MSHYKSFAVIGAGGIGKPIVEALLAVDSSVVVLSRSSSTKELALSKTAKVVGVDYTKAEDVASILRENKVEILISTIGGGVEALQVQKQVADAAKLAGIKLFVPSEFGVPTNGSQESIFKVKDEIASYVASLGISTARFFTGVFIEAIVYVTAFASTGKVAIIGKGQTPWSFTSKGDISGFLAHVLTTLPPPELNDKIFRIEGQRATLLEIATILKAPTEFVEKIPGDSSGLLTFLSKTFEEGKPYTSWSPADGKDLEEKEGNHNYLWTGHKWQSIEGGVSNQ